MDELISISRVRSAARGLGLKSMIVLQELPNGRWGYTSYGQTRELCKRAQAIADECLGAVEYAVAVEDGLI